MTVHPPNFFFGEQLLINSIDKQSRRENNRFYMFNKAFAHSQSNYIHNVFLKVNDTLYKFNPSKQPPNKLSIYCLHYLDAIAIVIKTIMFRFLRLLFVNITIEIIGQIQIQREYYSQETGSTIKY